MGAWYSLLFLSTVLLLLLCRCLQRLTQYRPQDLTQYGFATTNASFYRIHGNIEHLCDLSLAQFPDEVQAGCLSIGFWKLMEDCCLSPLKEFYQLYSPLRLFVM